MMNVSDAKIGTSNFDFEEFCPQEFDSWINSRSMSFSSDEEIHCKTDESQSQQQQENGGLIASIFSQSIDMIGSAVAPWPGKRPTLGLEASAAVFIKSESPTEVESSQRALSKLRRSNSGRQKRFSLSRINEEDRLNSNQLYHEMEPIPIVTAPKKELRNQVTNPVVPEIVTERERKTSSRFHAWITAFYNRNTASVISTDEESAVPSHNASKTPVKSILKKQKKATTIQKSVSISECEAKLLTDSSASSPSSQTSSKPSIKIRFDNEVSVCETFNKEDYCRQSLDYVARQLTPSLALAIKKELNNVKQEMEVHEDARHLTQFYLIK
jgi:hypothetical protein